MKNSKKKYLFITASVVMFLIIDQTIAYFSSNDSITNRIFAKRIPPKPTTFVQIDISEEFEPPSQKTDDPFRKDVKICNTGTEDCYVRVRLELSSSDYGDVTSFSYDGTNYTPYASYKTNLPEGWVYRDGFYYYTYPVSPGKLTGTSLISWAKVDHSPATATLPDEFDIFVYAEAVQTYDEEGSPCSYIQAWEA
ncbi:MAG: hypothetical protein IIZ53_02540 [Ruminococcus sp.]|nr:hypothetical protein [Ruminococcus sp.]